MVIYEDYVQPGFHIDLEKAYSDQHVYIEYAGVFYDEAINEKSLGIRYNETDIPIGDLPQDAEYAQAGRILLGVEQ